jgi:hypothetical protein
MPNFSGDLDAAGIQVDADDLVGAYHLRGLDHVQADAAQAEHHDVGARLDLGREHDCAHARGDAATDVAALSNGRIRADLRHGDFRHHDVVREGRGAHVVVERLAIQREARSPVGHQAASLRRADLLAQVGLLREAEFALPAFRRVERNHVVVGLDRGDAGAGFQHDAGAFMAEDGGEDAFRIGPTGCSNRYGRSRSP